MARDSYTLRLLRGGKGVRINRYALEAQLLTYRPHAGILVCKLAGRAEYVNRVQKTVWTPAEIYVFENVRLDGDGSNSEALIGDLVVRFDARGGK